MVLPLTLGDVLWVTTSRYTHIQQVLDAGQEMNDCFCEMWMGQLKSTQLSYLRKTELIHSLTEDRDREQPISALR